MKKVLLTILYLVSCSAMFAQDLPTNSQPGKCYVRCVTPDVWVNQDVTVQVAPAYKKLSVVPETYNTVTEYVVVQAAGTELTVVPARYETQNFDVTVQKASQRLEVIPAVWGTKSISYKKREFGITSKVVPAQFTSSYQVIEVKPGTAKWEMSDTPAAECQSSNPNDCRYWCYKSVPAQNITINTTELDNDASVVTTPGCDTSNGGDDCGMSTYTQKVIETPATTRVIDIPAETKTS